MSKHSSYGILGISLCLAFSVALSATGAPIQEISPLQLTLDVKESSAQLKNNGSAAALFIHCSALSHSNDCNGSVIPDDPTSYRIEDSSRWFDAIVAQCEGALKRTPDNYNARFLLARAHLTKGFLVAQQTSMLQAWRDQLAAFKASEQNQNGTTSIDLKPYIRACQKTIQELETRQLQSKPSELEHLGKSIRYWDELIRRYPNDQWAIVYRAITESLSTSDPDRKLSTLLEVKKRFPNNPALQSLDAIFEQNPSNSPRSPDLQYIIADPKKN